MYPVSDAFMQAIKSNTRKYYWTGTITTSDKKTYEFLSLLSKACHVELAQTKEEIEALPNGTELLGIYQDNNFESWRDFLYYLAQTLGCFAVIDRYGKLSLTSYGSTPVMAIDIRHRFSSSFSDFVTRYTAVSSTNKKTETAEYYAKDPDDWLTMNLGVNPLLQFGLEETRKRIINTILEVVSTVEYVPFDSETIGNPALDLGDVLRFTGGHADETKQSAVTSIYTKINGRTVNETVLENVVVQAINTLLGDKSTYQAQLQQNIAKVIKDAGKATADGIDERLMELQKELLKKANNKKAYDEIADQIFKLREQRQQCTVDTAGRDAQIARINDLQDFIKQQPAHLEAFDEALVKRWLERIIVWEDHFTVELKSGLKIEIEG